MRPSAFNTHLSLTQNMVRCLIWVCKVGCCSVWLVYFDLNLLTWRSVQQTVNCTFYSWGLSACGKITMGNIQNPVYSDWMSSWKVTMLKFGFAVGMLWHCRHCNCQPELNAGLAKVYISKYFWYEPWGDWRMHVTCFQVNIIKECHSHKPYIGI